MTYIRKYGVATVPNTHIYIPMIKAGANNFAHSGDWTPVSGDVLIQKDGNIPPNSVNLLPIYSGCAWAFRFTADEMQAKTISVCIADSGTKTVEDQFFTMETYQDNSGMYPISITPSGIEADIKAVSQDIDAANNMELMYDGTGYSDVTAPSSRAQVDGIGAASGGSLNFEASEDNTGGAIKSISFVGSQTNTYTNTDSEDGAYHTIDDTGNEIDIVYGFDIGGNRTAVEVVLKGYLSSGNDELNIQAYNFVGASWDTRGTLLGQAGSTNITQTISLLSRHTGTGADLGKVYIRFQNTGQSNPQLNVDELLVAAVNIGNTVGYAQGAVWVDTVNGTAGVESFVNGTADKPVSSWTNAQTIAGNVGISRYKIISGSTISLDQSIASKELFGETWNLNLNNQTITSAIIDGANVATGSGVGENALFKGCIFDHSVTIPPCIVRNSYFGNMTWILSSGNYFFNDCIDRATGLITPKLDFGSGIPDTLVNLHNYAGGIELEKFGSLGTDESVVSGNGRIIVNENSPSGTLTVLGVFDIDNNSPNAIVIQKAALNRANLVGYAEGSVWINGGGSNAGTQSYTDGTADNPVNNLSSAKTIADDIGLKSINMLPGTSLTLDQDFSNYRFGGTGYSINLGNQNIGGSRFFNGAISGSGYGTGRIVLTSCFIGGPIYLDTVSNFLGCNLSTDTIVLKKPGTYTFDRCFSGVAGTETPSIDITTSGNTVSLNLRHYSGGIELKNFGKFNTHRGSIEGHGQVKLNANCGPSGVLAIRGIFKLTDNTNGGVGLVKTDPTNEQVHQGTARGGTSNSIILDESASSTNGTYDPGFITIIAGSGAGETRSIVDYYGGTKTAIVQKDWRNPPHTNSSYIITSEAGQPHVNEGLVRGSSSNKITLNTFASSVDNIYRGQSVFVTAGTGADQSRIVIDYNGSSKIATVNRAWDTLPASGDSYIMMPLPADGEMFHELYNQLTSSLEPTAVPAASSTIAEKTAWMFSLARNKIEQFNNHQLAYADDGSTVIGSGDYTGNNPLTRSEWN